MNWQIAEQIQGFVQLPDRFSLEPAGTSESQGIMSSLISCRIAGNASPVLGIPGNAEEYPGMLRCLR